MPNQTERVVAHTNAKGEINALLLTGTGGNLRCVGVLNQGYKRKAGLEKGLDAACRVLNNALNIEYLDDAEYKALQKQLRANAARRRK